MEKGSAGQRQQLPHEGSALRRINARRNNRKAEGYWLGFLEGVLASGRIEGREIYPLRLEAEKFLSLLKDPDAFELLDDLRIWEDEPKEIHAIIETILDVRRQRFQLEDDIDERNNFYGFCAGIACDNVITVREVSTLIAKLDGCRQSKDDARLMKLRMSALASIADGNVTPEESDDICGWISRLVGDSANDTGLATYGNVVTIDGALKASSELVFRDKVFVLTGKFFLGPRKAVSALISERGGTWKNNVCHDTDYLVVASEASRDWRHSHEGTKIIQALDLRSKGKGPVIVHESTFAEALETS